MTYQTTQENSAPRPMKAICYKDWRGKWVRDPGKPTAKRLAWIRKHKALNGQATIQEI
jgi:hypothetical protein